MQSLIDKAWIQTYSGKAMRLLNPRQEDICIEDIAHALANICRYSGQCDEFFSVAQHSVNVSYICDPADARQGLLHDASEAYIADISTPLKKTDKMAGYREIENKLQMVIYEKFDLPYSMKPSVHLADKIMLTVEANCLIKNIRQDWSQWMVSVPANCKIKTVVPLLPKQAEQLFLDRYKELFLWPM